MKTENAEKKFVDRLERSEKIDGNEMVYNGTLNDYEQICNSCTTYIALLFTAF